MANLTEAFRSPDSRVTKTVVTVDLSNSTSMKEQQPEANWLTTYAWFFDLLGTTIAKHGGCIVKYLGDGAMAVFNDVNAAEAINWAIEVQEAISEAQQNNRVSCDCTIGIAYGEMVQFDSPSGPSDSSGPTKPPKDYIGSVVDRAFRLGGVASPNAIFVDLDTVSAALMPKVRSRIGAILTPKRKPAEYQGPEEKVKLKGFASPVAYHEILWSMNRYGIKSAVVTDLSSRSTKAEVQVPLPAPIAPVQPAAGGSSSWVRGKVKQLTDRYGFIAGPNGEDFWFNRDQLFYRDAPTQLYDEVFFVPADPYPNSKNRRATQILSIGLIVSGRLTKVFPQGYGFVRCESDHGDVKDIFVSLGSAEAWAIGMEIEFRLGENPKGPAGYEPKRLEA